MYVCVCSHALPALPSLQTDLNLIDGEWLESLANDLGPPQELLSILDGDSRGPS